MGTRHDGRGDNRGREENTILPRARLMEPFACSKSEELPRDPWRWWWQWPDSEQADVVALPKRKVLQAGGMDVGPDRAAAAIDTAAVRNLAQSALGCSSHHVASQFLVPCAERRRIPVSTLPHSSPRGGSCASTPAVVSGRIAYRLAVGI